MLSHTSWEVDAVWVPELEVDFDAECERLAKRMDDHDNVNIFLSEGAGVDAIVEQIEKETGQPVPRDAFGHVKLDDINPGKWFGDRLKERLGAEKVLVQKSGYFARSAAPNKKDLSLILACCGQAARSALDGVSGVAGLDEDNGGKLSTIDFPRIKGGKPFDYQQEWYTTMLEEIGQPLGKPSEAQ